MRIIRLLASVTFLLAGFSYCSKSTASAETVISYLRTGDVTVGRDSTNTTVRFRITLAPASATTVNLDYVTEAGTANAGTEFISRSGTITIEPGKTEAFVEIQVIGSRSGQGNKEFYLKLSNPKGARLENDRGTATLISPVSEKLVWSDEFDSPVLNVADWNYETGASGWGNNELQNYLAGNSNAYLQNGSLIIEAKKENNGYTSARLTTNGKRLFTYGRMEIRAKVPVAKGIWPALWMLGSNIGTLPWPACGEIDIMENIGEVAPSKSYGTAHWGLSTSAHLSKGGVAPLAGSSYADSFHVYTLDWTATGMQWLIDGKKFFEVIKDQITGGNMPFDKPFFFIVNLAVGGNWPGNPDASTVFPQKLYVDYIRVYQKS